MRDLLENRRALRICFYALLLAALLLQSYVMELGGDEAYYWRYSLQLAWGYFDHPPLVGWVHFVFTLHTPPASEPV